MMTSPPSLNDDVITLSMMTSPPPLIDDVITLSMMISPPPVNDDVITPSDHEHMVVTHQTSGFLAGKSHLAFPCGHQCARGPCSERMQQCPYCRTPVRQWLEVRVV